MLNAFRDFLCLGWIQMVYLVRLGTEECLFWLLMRQEACRNGENEIKTCLETEVSRIKTSGERKIEI